MNAAEQQISLYQDALTNLEQAKQAQFSSAVLQALIARDKVALALREETDPPDSTHLDLLGKTDQRLVAFAEQYDASRWRETLEDWRYSLNPEASAWWWMLEDHAKKTWSTRLSTLLAILLVLASFGLIADTFNLLRGVGANPISTMGALIQAALGFVAASVFTEKGQQWLVDRFSRFRGLGFTRWARTGLALMIFLSTLAIRYGIPWGAAYYFHWVGDGYYREGLYEQAATSYRQASSLKPYAIPHHAALAKAEERSTDFAEAIAEYKNMAALYELSGATLDDSYFFAKCELVKLLISHDKNYALAEKTIKDLQGKISKVSEQNQTQVQYFLLTYKQWIELDQKNLGTARDGLEFVIRNVHDGPAARYLLALALEQLKQDSEARHHLSEFLRLLQTPQFEEVPFEWVSYAQERTVNQ